jgi:hypothetical protein
MRIFFQELAPALTIYQISTFAMASGHCGAVVDIVADWWHY